MVFEIWIYRFDFRCHFGSKLDGFGVRAALLMFGRFREPWRLEPPWKQRDGARQRDRRRGSFSHVVAYPPELPSKGRAPPSYND